MKKITYIVLPLLILASCVKDNNKVDPEPQPEYPNLVSQKNTYYLNGEIFQFKSVIATTIGDNLVLAGSPQEGLDYEAIFSGEYPVLSVGLSPLLVSTDFDPVSEEKLYTIYSSLSGFTLEELSPRSHESLLRGTVSSNSFEEEGRVCASGALELEDGTLFGFDLEIEDFLYKLNANSIFVDFAANDMDAKQLPVRAAFLRKSGEELSLYFTSGDIEYAEDLEICNNYLSVTQSIGLCDGLRRNVTAQSPVELKAVDNSTGDVVKNTAASELEGTYSLYVDPENPNYFVFTLDLEMDGNVFKMEYRGEPTDYLLAKPFPQGIFLKNETRDITEVSYREENGVAIISLKDNTEREAQIFMPVSDVDGKAHGFSQNPDIYKVVYDSQTYSKPNGNVGTLTVSRSETNLRVEFTNYSGLKIAYQGGYELL